MRRITLTRIASFLLFIGFTTNTLAELTMLVNAPRSPINAQKKWSAFADYISKATGEPVKIVAVAPGKTEAFARTGKADIMLVNPVMASLVSHRYKGELLATLNRNSGSRFGGVIISKKGSGITRAKDVRGKSVMTYKKASAAAYTFQMDHLKKHGISEADFASARIAKRQDDIVLAVRAGVVDVGFVKTGLLEAMAKEDKISLNDFEIVDRKSEGYAHAHSTILYPEWYLLATSTQGKKHSSKITGAALSLTPDNPASKKAKIKGFVKPVNMKDLDATLRSMRVAPFDT